MNFGSKDKEEELNRINSTRNYMSKMNPLQNIGQNLNSNNTLNGSRLPPLNFQNGMQNGGGFKKHINGIGLINGNAQNITNSNSYQNSSNIPQFSQQILNDNSNEDLLPSNNQPFHRMDINLGNFNNHNYSQPHTPFSQYNNNQFNPSNLNFNYENLSSELLNAKRMLKNLMENQNDLQSKLIDNSKIIHEQENIIRLNNLKLNEHDSKLTEILITFNNYLQLNDKTTKIVNDMTFKFEDSVKKSEFSELKATLYNFNKNNELKISGNSNKLEELETKSMEIIKEQEIFQKYTLDKLKSYQSESMEARIQQNQQLIKHEESRENKINQQFEHVKGLIKIIEKNLINEAAYRKNMIENSQEEILREIVKRDDRILNLEKNNLETEKKFINFNKDSIIIFQELISKHNQKYDIELKSIKSILENGFLKLDSKYEEQIKKIDTEIFNLKNNYKETNNSMLTLESYFKENFDSLENKLIFVEKESDTLKNKHSIVSETISKYISENPKLIEEKIDEKLNSLENKINKNFTELNTNFQIELLDKKKQIIDLSEKLENLNKNVSGLIIFKNDKLKQYETNENSMNSNVMISHVDLLILERKIDDKIFKAKEEINGFEKKVVEMLKANVDGVKNNLDEDYRSLVHTISDKLDLKIKVLEKEIFERKNEDDIIIEGRIQEYIVESEERIKKLYEQRVSKIQADLERLEIKNDYKQTKLDTNEEFK